MVYVGFTVYVNPPMVSEVVEKVSVAIPVSKPSVPESVPTKLPAPAGDT